ncbi:epoxide hydrolase family protein [uncultured Jatrophihabitans sp.]|uniref:epoxide hydrolase family protein n=1 Tax=uncultured Jatrophihabitans sp. TaxID=1610747 RepID=UPI0035CC1930
MTGTGPFDAVTDAELDDLRQRLRRTRWPRRWPGDVELGWAAGTPDAVVRRLTDVWATTYDWRRYEREIAELPWGRAHLHGTEVAFLLYEGRGPAPLPIVLTNGWPSSFWELRNLAAQLSLGQAAGPAFTVVVPCLPGFPGTDQAAQFPAAVPTHELWHALMAEHLGYRRFGAHGGDLGAGPTSLLGQEHPDEVLGIHLTSIADPLEYDSDSLTSDERGYLDEAAHWSTDEGAYEHLQMTRPQTLSYGLSDSPAGLLAWMVEKYFAWTDNDGTLESVFDDDEVLTQASLYWFGQCISTSFRPYFEFARGHGLRVARVDVPTAVAVFPKDLVHPPRSWAERTYNVQRYTRMARGGHFAALEETQLLADDIAEFFAPLR